MATMFNPQQYQQTQAQIALMNSLGQGAMQAQGPQSTVVPGGAPGAGGFVVAPSRFSAAGSVLNKILGAYMLKQGINKQAQLNSDVSNYIGQTLNPSDTSGTSQGGASSSSSTPQGTPAQGSGTQGSVGTQAGGPTDTSSNGFNMQTFLQLGQLGPQGQEAQQIYAQRIPHANVQQNKYGGYTVFDQFGNVLRQLSSGGVPPEAIAPLANLEKQTDPTNAASMKSLNDMRHQYGFPPLSPAAVAGQRATPVDESTIKKNVASAASSTASAAKTAAETPLASAVQASQIASNQAGATSKAVTLAKGLVDGYSTENGNFTALSTQKQTIDQAEQIIKNVIAKGEQGGGVFNTLQDVKNHFGGASPEWAAVKDAATRLQAADISQLMHGARGMATAIKTWGPDLASGKMPTATLLWQLQNTSSYLGSELGASQAKMGVYKDLAQRNGIELPGQAAEPVNGPIPHNPIKVQGPDGKIYMLNDPTKLQGALAQGYKQVQ